MLMKLYTKNRLAFAISWIVCYCILLSVGDALSTSLGTEKLVTFPIALVLSAILWGFLKTNRLASLHGLCRSTVPMRSMLYYLPLAAMLTANLWYGVALQFSPLETVLYILTMLCVGFLEELIFRGLLFRAMQTNNRTAAVIVSSVTFGMGHILNLVNGSGAALIPNLLQVIYATAAGFMFVMIVLKTDSLFVCIAAHGLFNALSAFADEAPTASAQILSCLALTVITGSYAVWLAWTMRRNTP